MDKCYAPIGVSSEEESSSYLSRVRSPFNDTRNYKTWQLLSKQMLAKASGVVNQIAKTGSQAKQFYRFLGNKRIQLSEMIKMSCEIAADNLEGCHALVLGDSSSYNLSKHVGRIQDVERIGVLEDNKTAGFMAHVNMALNAQTGDILGLSDILLWSRLKVNTPKATTKHAYQIAWDQKESYKWALGAENSCKVLQKAALRTFVFDRDSDNYDLLVHFMKIPRCHFIIRSCHDRKIEWKGQEMVMSQALGQNPILGTYELDLPALNHYSGTSGKRIYRKARKAHIEVRATAVDILPPRTAQHPGGPTLLRWLVEARETGFQPTEGETQEPVLWRLLTSHPVHTFDEAVQIIYFYTLRWIIEQLFRTTKTEGFALEATELETFDAIQRQTIMVLQAATKVLQLLYARGRYDSQPIGQVFTAQEQIILQRINEEYQGTSQKQQNPFPQNQTSWATWVIARLGGWKGYASQRPPGPITMKKGLELFYAYKDAFLLFDNST